MYTLLRFWVGCGIIIPTKRRRSILVRSVVSEEGPKNPLKGIAVKPLVPASYAQFGVVVGGKATACLRGDLFMCIGVRPLWYMTYVRLRVETCNAV